jgi:predicted Ser/Thr protein kinase
MNDEKLPERIGRYRLQSRLAAGGMGRVFLALDSDGSTVALKQLHPAIADDDNMRERLRREVAAMRRVRSPRVARLLDADLEADPPYIVTRYVQGRTLREVVSADGPLEGERLARVAAGIAEALAVIHAAGHVHRDLKPGNVMIVGGDPVVIDFGIAQEQEATRITQEGGSVGTIGYMAPEVLNGGPSGPAADVFAWGATIAYAATGRPAFGGGTLQAVALRTYRGDADIDGIDDGLRPLVAAALTPDPAARPDVQTLVRVLAAPSDRIRPAWPAPGSGPARTPVAPREGGAGPVAQARGRKMLWVSALAAVVALAALLVFLVAPGDAHHAPRAAATRPSVASSAPARPSYTGTIANWAPGKKFEKFLAANAGKKVYIGASLSADVLPQSVAGVYEPNGQNKDPYFVFWTSCFEPLTSGEPPTYDKCVGFQVTVLGRQPAFAGLHWAHGVYFLQGNFEIAQGAIYQGVGTFALKPTEAT